MNTWLRCIKRPLGKPRRRWEDYIKMDLNAVGFENGGPVSF